MRARERNMDYFDTVKKLFDDDHVAGNALEHELCEIVQEVRAKRTCTRDFVVMNNIYFRLFDVFKPGWQKQLQRFCDAFNFGFSVIDNGTQIRFSKRS